MLRKWCPEGAQAGPVSSICHNSQPVRALGRNPSSANAQKLILPGINNPGCTTSSRRNRRSLFRRANRLQPQQALLQTSTDQRSPGPELEQFFCGTHSIEHAPVRHPFVFDINIRMQHGRCGRLRRVMKRVLLDTGSDLSLISSAAHADLRTPIQRQKCKVQSVAGQSSIIGQTQLSWTFLRSCDPDATSLADFSDVFFVLSSTESPLFDCILGRHWIQTHRAVFLALWSG